MDRIADPWGDRTPYPASLLPPGTVFVPFHYARRAANELTVTAWDPVSKQPRFKLAAVRVRRIGE